MRVGVFIRLLAVALLLVWVLALPCSSDTHSDPNAVLYRALYGCLETVDLSSFKIPKENAPRLLRDVLYNSPELFYVGGKFAYSYNSQGYLLSITPIYKVTGAELDEQRAVYNAKIQGLMADCPDGATDAEAVLYIHDVLASNFDYDTDYKAYDAYSFFESGRGVCQAYSLAFIALCRTRGIDASMAVSNEMDHAWNTVCIDGAYYHVDVTRDDLVGDAGVLHTAFLRSDGGMRALGYYGYEAKFPCDNTKFDGLLDGVESKVTFSENGIFAFNGQGVLKVTLSDTPLLTPLCEGDTNGDGEVNLHDLLSVIKGENIPLTLTDKKRLLCLVLERIAKKYLDADGWKDCELIAKTFIKKLIFLKKVLDKWCRLWYNKQALW